MGTEPTTLQQYSIAHLPAIDPTKTRDLGVSSDGETVFMTADGKDTGRVSRPDGTDIKYFPRTPLEAWIVSVDAPLPLQAVTAILTGQQPTTGISVKRMSGAFRRAAYAYRLTFVSGKIAAFALNFEGADTADVLFRDGENDGELVPYGSVTFGRDSDTIEAAPIAAE